MHIYLRTREVYFSNGGANWGRMGILRMDFNKDCWQPSHGAMGGHWRVATPLIIHHCRQGNDTRRANGHWINEVENFMFKPERQIGVVGLLDGITFATDEETLSLSLTGTYPRIFSDYLI
ncbi:hypothetical protein BDQ17DRAFT_1339304 [Cyathus striatus]|nr:hypothetical protein BDQ17DRAFT_1339304 [Cyathus striatus]